MKANKELWYYHEYWCDKCGKTLKEEDGVYIYHHNGKDYHFCPAQMGDCMKLWIKERRYGQTQKGLKANGTPPQTS